MNEPKRDDLPPLVREFIKVQESRNDPGSWLGGDIDPVFTARRPNRYGYAILVSGAVAAMFAAYYFRLRDWLPVTFFVALCVLSVLAGIKMLRKPKDSPTSTQ